MAGNKNFVGSGWRKDFTNGGYLINVSLKKDQIAALEPDKYGNVRIVVAPRQKVDEKSKADHLVYEDTFRKGGTSSAADF